MLTTIQNDGLQVNFCQLPALLSPFVQLIYEVKGKPSLGSQRVFPRNGVELNFNLGQLVQARTTTDQTQLKQTECLFLGNRSTYFDYTPQKEVHLFIIKFTLNGFYRLFNIGQNAFGDVHLYIKELFAHSADYLNERLLEKDSVLERFELLLHWLKKAYSHKRDKGHYVVPYLIERIYSHPFIRIKDLEKETGFSRKHLFTRFKNETGLSPKQFQRVVRFDLLLKQIKANPNWLDIAFDLGFYDQSHLTKDVQHFAGLSPKQLLTSGFSFDDKVMPLQRWSFQ